MGANIIGLLQFSSMVTKTYKLYNAGKIFFFVSIILSQFTVPEALQARTKCFKGNKLRVLDSSVARGRQGGRSPPPLVKNLVYEKSSNLQ